MYAPMLYDPRACGRRCRGLLCGLATLARAELVLLAPLLLVPVVLGRGEGLKCARLTVVVAVLLGAVVVVAPWVLYNRSRFEESTFVSTNDGIAMLGSICDAVYHGGALGLTNLFGFAHRRAATLRARAGPERVDHYMKDSGPGPPGLAARSPTGLFPPRRLSNATRPPGGYGRGYEFYYPSAPAVAAVCLQGGSFWPCSCRRSCTEHVGSYCRAVPRPASPHRDLASLAVAGSWLPTPGVPERRRRPPCRPEPG